MTKRARIKVKPAAGKARATTTRHEAQAQFNRKKQIQHRRHMRRRVALAACGVVAVALAIGSWRMEHSGMLQRWAQQVSDAGWQLTADAGFSVNQVYLMGREHADASVVKAALGIQPGAAILQLPLKDMQAKLEAIPEVKSAFISRRLPDAISITLTERTPVAVWQHGDSRMLVDNDGVVLAKGNYPNAAQLPVVVGEDAPKHVRELTALLAAEPRLQHDVVAAVRIGDRRWNVQLKHDITVMLPEIAPDAAWKRFSALVQRDGLLNKAIRSVDMRMEDRVFIMPLEQKQNMITLTTAKDV